MKTDSTQFTDELVRCFAAGDVQLAREVLDACEALEACELAERDSISDRLSYRAHQALRRFVSQNDGHCYQRHHLEIADLLTSAVVVQFRDAVVHDRTDSVKMLLAKNPELANADMTAGRGIARPIHHFVSTDVAKLLVDAGAEIDVLTTRNESPIATQARFGTLDGLRFLLSCGADPNLGSCPHFKSESMDDAIVLMLAHDWDIQTNNQLLHDANHGHGTRVQTWLRHGVDPNIKASETKRTALHLLAARGTGRAAIRSLVDAGADISVQDQNGQTPLDLARQATKRTAENVLIALREEA